MKYKKIILAGGSGYLGGVFADYYKSRSEKVIILSRHPKKAVGHVETIVWDGKTAGNWTTALEGADLLINLCGKNVNCRYTEKNKTEIINSRVLPTTLLGKVVAGLKNPPELWINITSATIYRHAEDKPQDERAGDIGHGFSIEVCKTWEKSFFDTDTPRTRKIALRMAIVLGENDGVFPRLLNLVKIGMGGRQGSGEQYISWVHEHDAARCTAWLSDHKEISGIVNCSAPNAVKNKVMMQMIRKAYGISVGLPAPAWLLEIGAVLIGTETELILKSRWVMPGVLLDAGFNFEYDNPEQAIHAIIDRDLQN